MKRSSLIACVAVVAGSWAAATPDECRCFPGDSCWPTDDIWTAFNTSVGGNLIRTVPVGSVCHDPHYDEAACEALRAEWLDINVHITSSHSVMSGPFSNPDCDPFTARETPCKIGTYVEYSVNATDADAVSKTIQFANEKNIRLVIRNTGHDYLGKSSGAGAIAIWLHHMAGISLEDWKDKDYTGKAIKVAAGTVGEDVINFLDPHGLTTITGHCPSVAVAGGFVQGGGHGPLSSTYGMAADSVLEFEVVDGSGKKLVANRNQNADLFWALRGGGGGTYGVVLSMTTKVYPDVPATFGKVMFGGPSTGLDKEIFVEAVAKFHSLIPTLVDAGFYALWTFSNDFFAAPELTAVGSTKEQFDELLKPFTDFLDDNKVAYQKDATFYPNYKGYYDQLEEWKHNQANNMVGGSWFIPRKTAADQEVGKALIDITLEGASNGVTLAYLAFNVNKEPRDWDSAVLPGWRDMLLDVVIGFNWKKDTPQAEQLTAAVATLADDYIPKVKALAPNAGTYMSEALYQNPEWKTDFYGSNYDKLLEIKDKYDPDHLFYALTAVGSDYWVEKDRRLCKAEPSAHVKDEL